MISDNVVSSIKRIGKAAQTGNSALKRVLVTLLCLIQAVVLTACVTTVEGPFTAKASKSKAVEQYVQLGLAYYQNQEYELAIDKLTRALEIEPKDAEAHAALGLVYQAQAEPKYAEEQFRLALKHKPDYTRGRTYLGAFLFQQGRLEESVQEFEKASQDVRYEARAQIFSNLGLLYFRTDQLERAIEAYEKSLTLRRGQPNVYLSLSTLHFRTDDLARANRYYQMYWEQVRNGNAVHTAQSLFLGINIARDKKDPDEEASLTLLLKNLFPNSAEYKTIKESS